MRLFTKTKAILIIGCMSLGLLAGCGANNVSNKSGGENSGTDVEISYWNAGLGDEFLKKMIAEFKKVKPEYNVFYTATASVASVKASLGQKDYDTVDLYASAKIYDSTWMEPLDDVLNSSVDGNNLTMREKFSPSYLKLEKANDGKYYNLTYGGGILGIVYNKKLFEKAGIKQLPRTVNELAAVCDKLYGSGITPIAHFKGGGYWRFISDLWEAQYEGVDYYYNNFYSCKDEKGVSPSKEVFTKKDGRYQAIKAFEKFITPNYVLAGSNSNDHITMQTLFLNGKSAMMVSGSWLYNEMKSSGDTQDFEMMKTPVISTIIDKLTTIKSETDLRRLITAIDAVADGSKPIADFKKSDNTYQVDELTVSDSDWNYVKTARNSVASNYAGEGFFVPKYSNSKEGAKEFLKFFFSDAGYKIYLDTLHIELPLSSANKAIDTTGWNSFELSQHKLGAMVENHVSSLFMGQHRIFTDGGASAYAGFSYIDLFCSNNANDRIASDEVWKKIIQLVDDNYEKSWLSNIK